jgi:hypothetical protein
MEKESALKKAENEIKELKSKRETLGKEWEEKLKAAGARHEKELEKLRAELARSKQHSKSTFLSELENQQSQLEA